MIRERKNGFSRSRALCGVKFNAAPALSTTAGVDSSTRSRVVNTRLPIKPDTLAKLCKRHRIRRLSLFGSQLKGTGDPTATSTCW